MPRPNDDQVIETIRLYREALRETQTLYIDSGKLVRGSYGWLGDENQSNADSVAAQMNDLHQGLLMKVFASVVPNASAKSMEQRQLGRVLLEHIWGKSVLGSQLHEAVQWLVSAADDFQWHDLVRPFVELPDLRDRWAELETLAIRMAQLIAAVDGTVCLSDNAKIQEMEQQFDLLRSRAPETLKKDVDTENARDALTWLRNEAARLRSGVGAATAEKPTPTTSPSPPTANQQPNLQRKSLRQQSPDEIEAEDTRSPEERLAEAQAKLDRLIGLDNVKDQISTLTNFLAMERKRAEMQLPTSRPSLHMAFVGNPGTGKTTVARIVAEIYGALGILSKGHLVETDRSGLVAEYAGQTGPKTNAKIDEALDGVLFIDEAYTLIDDSGQDQYGREAVQTLLKRMEDQRDRLVVILAGYPIEMRQMIRSNPGLSSRVGTTMEFADYSPESLCRIFELIASKSHYTLPTESRRRLLRGFTYLYAKRDRHFGNGRTARNSLERSVRRLANRLASVKQVTRELLTTLEPEDIEVAGVDQEHLAAMAATKGSVRVECHANGCESDGGNSTVQLIDDQLLGTEISCEGCNKTFVALWGEPVVDLPASNEAQSN